jgi:hypothetical protein
MKRLNRFTHFSELSTMALLAGACAIMPVGLHASDRNDAPRSFASPDEAVKALQNAAAANDEAAMCEIFGPDFQKLSTGDKVQDGNNAQKFAAAITQGCKPVTEGEDKITLELGTNNWPMPIPLVKVDGQHFCRHVGGGSKRKIANQELL